MDFNIYYMKKCTKCDEFKVSDDFHKSSKSIDGYKSICKKCVLSKEKERRETDLYKENYKVYRESISDNKKKEYRDRYYSNNKESILLKNKEYREKNKEFIKEIGVRYREENKEIISDKKREYREKEHSKELMKEWRNNNPEKVKQYRDKYKDSISYKEDKKKWYKSIKERKPYVLAWRTLLNNTLKRFNKKKESETIKLLGYSPLQLKEHIEFLFLEGMSWENYGEWHIDHIKMVSSFEPNTPIYIVNSLENLRPLWAKDNCSRKLN